MAEIPAGDWIRINDAADRFERAWKQGSRPKVEDYLDEAEPGLRAALFEELLRVELELRRRDGETPAAKEYFRRFPHQAALIEAVFRGEIPAFSGEGARNGAPGPRRASLDRSPMGGILAALSRTIGSVPRVMLRETEIDGETGVVRPASREMPPAAGRYQLLGQIGRGGMGAVLKGRDPDLGRDLAVKVLLEEHCDDRDLVRRFIEEAQIGGQLQHPGIVPVHELGRFDDGRPYFTMKLVKGRTLAALLADREAPEHDRPRFLGIFEQVCQTVAYAHARGVIHRDLKPSNIMVGSFGEVQVMDWGLAKVLPQAGDDEARVPAEESALSVIRTVRSGSDADASRAGSMLGTPAYMAPEQARGEVEGLSERSDVFGLGSILCEVLTGEPAYAGASRIEIVLKARRGETADALKRLGGCGADADLVSLAERCLEVNPEDRPRDASEVARRLDAYLAGVQERLRAAERAKAAEEARTEEARATAAAAEGRARAERRTRRMTVGLAASLLIAGTLGAAGWRWVERERLARIAAVSTRVNEVLQEAMRLRGRAQGATMGDLVPWTEALAAVQQARELLGAGSDRALRGQVETLLADITAEKLAAEAAARAAKFDRALLDRLAEIRTMYVHAFDASVATSAYVSAFREAGIDILTLPPGEAGARIRARPAAVAIELAAGLDHWADLLRFSRNDRSGAARLSAVARGADPDPWRGRLREAQTSADHERMATLQQLAASPTPPDLPAFGFNLLAMGLSTGGDLKTAVSVLRQGVRRHPRDVWLNFNLADCLSRLNRREEAIPYFMVARFFRPEAGFQFARLLADEGETDEAIAVMQDLTRLKPGNNGYLVELGRMLNERGRASEASAALGAAAAGLNGEISRDPKNALPHGYLGLALTLQGKLDEGTAEWREMIRLKPDEAWAHTNLGCALREQGKLEEAVAECREAIRLEPGNNRAHHDLGVALFFQGNLGEAVAEYREAIRLKPDLAGPHGNLGLAMKAQGKLDEAIAEEHEAIRLKPDLAQAHDILGSILLTQRKVEEAITEFREAIRLKPDYACAYHNLGNALRAQEKMEEGIAEYRNALPHKPDHANHHSDLAWSLVLPPNRPRRDYDEGLVQARKAVELAPKNGDFVNTLALAEYRSRHWAGAITACERSMALRKGGDASDWFFLAMAHARKSEQDPARTWFDKAVSWTKDKGMKNKELLQFWAEAAELLDRPGPGASGLSSLVSPTTEKPR
jgi:serine/threonine-protein kinase